MAGKLSFAIAINLLTENFKRGTSQVKSGLKAMQMQMLTFAAALGAGGLGLSNFVSRLIDVARETNRVTTALKNVSGSTGQFADNQRYLVDLAKKYGLEINALTGNFAKFTAAASISGMSMGEQRKIFESVSRACTAFGMSADDSNGVFLALSQMMSKGKISSEELRLQMGERLPIALQAMAKAAGVSVAGLDKLLKQGKLMSADVLPKFAEALNEMIPNVDTDNLETSVNHLKNAFTEFVNGTDVQSKYKTLIDWLTGAVQEAATNIKSKISGIIAFAITLISGKLLASVVAYFGKHFKLIDTVVNKAEVAQAQMLLAGQKRIAAEKAYEATLTDYHTIENGKRLASKSQLNSVERAMNRAKEVEAKALIASRVAAENAAAVSTTSVFGKTFKALKLGFIQVGRTMKAVFMSSWPMILITAIGMAIGKLVEMCEESKRVRKIFSDYKKEAQSAGSTQEIIMLEKQLKIMNDKKKNLGEVKGAQSELQKMLGKEYKSQTDLNKAVADRIELLREAARANFHANKIPELEDEGKRIEENFRKKYGGNPRYSMKDMLTTLSDYGYDNKSGLPMGFRTKYGLSGTEGGVRDALIEYEQNLKSIDFANSELEKAVSASNKLTKTNDSSDTDENSKESPLQKAEAKYAQSLREIDARREVEKMSETEYYQAVDELGKKMLIEAKASGDKDILNSAYMKMLQGAIDSPLYNEVQAELEKVEKEYTDARSVAKAKLEQGLIAEDGYREAIIDAAMKAAESAASIEGIGSAADEFIKKMRNIAINNTLIPVLKKRDTTFDYKANGVDKAADNLDLMRQYRDDLEKAKQDGKVLSKELQADLDNAIKSIPDLEKALKLAEIKEDIKNFTKELTNLRWDAAKGIVGDIDSLVSAFKNLADAFDPESEADGWERLMALWNLFAGVVDSIMSVCNTLEAITEITKKLTQAKEAEVAVEQAVSTAKTSGAAIDTAVTGIQIANSEIKQSTDKEEALTAVTTANTEVAANTAEGVSAAGASAAGLPFPANLIAIGAAIAGALALFAMIPKFATGGIVSGGPSSGDKILARVNAGEMILNGGQQSRLFEAINSGRLGSGQNINIGFDRVRGADILLAVNNTLKRQGKKPIS